MPYTALHVDAEFHDTLPAVDRRADDGIDVIPEKRPDGLGFHFKVRGTGRLYRFEPTRDPRQPRYWCFRICRCLPSHLVDMTERPWLGAFGMNRDELPAATAAIRADPNAWLELRQLQPLRQWLLEEVSKPKSDAGAPPR